MTIIGEKVRLFGTDGIRGVANVKLTPDLVTKVGMVVGRMFRNGGHTTALIGKDTRRSGYMIENCLTGGITGAGMNVLLTGPIPTPAVAMLMRSMQANLGIMISASHNSFEDNGIKIFGPDGYKLSDEQERDIERLMTEPSDNLYAAGEHIGRAKRVEGVQERYITLTKGTISVSSLQGIRLVLDCANGAAYKVAPAVFTELGAEVITIGDEPDGFNINRGFGSTATQALRDKVRELRADVGIALDGDADRLIVVDENAEVVDGDQVLALIVRNWLEEKRLPEKKVVATVMSNLGLDEYLKSLGVETLRAQVGDRNVLEEMRKEGINLGGEQSGHIIMTDFATTGDGIIAGLQVLSVLKKSGKRMSEIAHTFKRFPQTLHNVPFRKGSDPLRATRVKQLIKRWEKELGVGGLLVRQSGTEPKIRVMAQHKDPGLVARAISEIASAIESASTE